MSSSYDKLRRILTLEKEQGFRNKAVIGGLDRFLTYWEREARQEGPEVPHAITVDEVVGALANYGDLAIAGRAQAIGTLLAHWGAGSTHLAANSSDAQQAERPSEAPSNDQPTPQPQPAPQFEPKPASAVNPAQSENKASTAPRASRKPSSPKDIALSLDASVTEVKGISTAMQTRLARLGVRSVRDLLYHLPRRYDDLTELKTINRLALGDQVTIVGIISDVKTQRTRRGQTMVRVVVHDGTGYIEARWFQPFLEKQFHVGAELVISGRVEEYLGRLLFNGPEWELLQRDLLNTARLVPTYPLTEGVGIRWLRRVIKNALDVWVPSIVDPLPPRLLQALDFAGLSAALREMHFPDTQESLERARQRLCFDEFLCLQLGVLSQRRVWRSQPGRALVVPRAETDELVAKLPFTLTGAQTRAIRSILTDMEQPVPMSRLLQGDVGSGKTVVAVVAMLATVRNGLQVALMAPTSILAEQHYRTIVALLASLGVSCALLEGSLSELEKEAVRQKVARGECQVLIGTHALIQGTVEFSKLGLVVVDEQHRFGVEQRTALRDKGAEFQPHLLAMSATPIPRTLAMTIYGDLDISVLDELPPSRKEVATAVRDKRSRERIYAFINSQIDQGHQVFIICPLVEDSENSDAKAAVSEYQRLQREVFPHHRLGLLHGRLSAEEKEQTMAAFRSGLYHILVSTAVIEVGIDIPNATVMLIEGAERFGLAQLHQFRGRVGRGEAKSYCILISDDVSEASIQRLQFMEASNDGFYLAEKDLEMRGPGDFFGVRQSGLPSLKVARLSDTAILEKARAAALAIFREDPDLTQPEHVMLAAEVKRFWSTRELIDVEVTP
jgi:ATP-dependent DNA helicase RecG